MDFPVTFTIKWQDRDYSVYMAEADVARDYALIHARSERQAFLFLSDYLRFLAGLRKRPASTAQKYL